MILFCSDGIFFNFVFYVLTNAQILLCGCFIRFPCDATISRSLSGRTVVGMQHCLCYFPLWGRMVVARGTMRSLGIRKLNKHCYSYIVLNYMWCIDPCRMLNWIHTTQIFHVYVRSRAWNITIFAIALGYNQICDRIGMVEWDDVQCKHLTEKMCLYCHMGPVLC